MILGAVLRHALRNATRHRLRSGLTVLGMVVAILAYGLLQTVVGAWYANANNASDTRLITRNSISLVFPMPLNYRQKIRAVEGLNQVSLANWFGAIYKEPKNFFAQFAVSDDYFAIYPEFIIDEDQMRDYRRDRRGCIVGRKLANTYGFKIGDAVTLKGTIFPGDWTFVVRAIYDGRKESTDETQFFFHWDFLNETVKQRYARRADQVGVFVSSVRDPDDMARVALEIDGQFRNSAAETLSETEKAFQLGFVAMTGAIVTAVELVSYVVIFIIMAVMANTMAMTARERTAEYATLKALGFSPSFVAGLVLAESLTIALIGGAIGIALTYPVAQGFAQAVGTLFPVFRVAPHTVLLQLACALLVGLLAAWLPARRAARVPIVEGLRSVV
ncbi:MAG TPA: FtsX-like permease family protein [Rhodocyclaceae bacterium]